MLGVVGDRDMAVFSDQEVSGMEMEYLRYQTHTSSDTMAKGVRVKHFTWEQVERATNLQVDTVVFDCEGCWCDVVATNMDKFRFVTCINKFLIKIAFRKVRKILIGKRVIEYQPSGEGGAR